MNRTVSKFLRAHALKKCRGRESKELRIQGSGGAWNCSVIRSRRTTSSSISSRRIRARPIISRPMATAPIAKAPTATAPSSAVPIAWAPTQTDVEGQARAPRSRDEGLKEQLVIGLFSNGSLIKAGTFRMVRWGRTASQDFKDGLDSGYEFST